MIPRGCYVTHSKPERRESDLLGWKGCFITISTWICARLSMTFLIPTVHYQIKWGAHRTAAYGLQPMDCSLWSLLWAPSQVPEMTGRSSLNNKNIYRVSWYNSGRRVDLSLVNSLTWRGHQGPRSLHLWAPLSSWWQEGCCSFGYHSPQSVQRWHKGKSLYLCVFLWVRKLY